MPLGTNHVALTEAATFIPELWTDEIIADYRNNLVMANLVQKMNHVGKKGDTIHIPSPSRGSASAKAAETQVTLIANTEGEVVISIDQHYEYSRLIEDIAAIQALASMRAFYTRDAGYALAKVVDSDLALEGELFNSGTAASEWTSGWTNTGAANSLVDFDNTASANAGNDGSAAVGDVSVREFVQKLDDNDVPFNDRYFVVPPSVKKDLLGVDRYSEEAKVGERASDNEIRNGLVKQVYGVDVFVSNNVTRFTTDAGTTYHHASLFYHRDAIVFVEQLRPRVQGSYIQEYLGTLMTADTIWGAKCVRPEAGNAFITRTV